MPAIFAVSSVHEMLTAVVLPVTLFAQSILRKHKLNHELELYWRGTQVVGAVISERGLSSTNSAALAKPLSAGTFDRAEVILGFELGFPPNEVPDT